jgi:hypothetical protein
VQGSEWAHAIADREDGGRSRPLAPLLLDHPLPTCARLGGKLPHKCLKRPVEMRFTRKEMTAPAAIGFSDKGADLAGLPKHDACQLSDRSPGKSANWSVWRGTGDHVGVLAGSAIKTATGLKHLRQICHCPRRAAIS